MVGEYFSNGRKRLQAERGCDWRAEAPWTYQTLSDTLAAVEGVWV